jgi:hypothetical protein
VPGARAPPRRRREPETLGLEPTRAELACQGDRTLGIPRRVELAAFGPAHEHDVMRDHLGALMTDPAGGLDRAGRLVQRALVLA